MDALTFRALRKSGRRQARAMINRVDRLGRQRPDETLARQSAAYWGHHDDEAWQRHSHWRQPFADRWDAIGRESLDVALLLARLLAAGLPSGRTVEWGAGGGANAIHFAPLCEEFVAVDIVNASLEECARQVRSVCDTSVTQVLIPTEEPESAVSVLGEGSCDLFLCFYVMELVPSPAYGLRVLAVAHQLLRPGGVAVVQIKYSNADPLSRPRRRGYTRGLADMTTYAIDEFWIEASRLGFQPVAVHLMPVNQLDRRYAYFLLTKPASDDSNMSSQARA